jgi:fructose-1,6-bisphosphatase-3
MGNITPESIVNDLRYLQLLSRSFPTIADASTEIINLEAILNLPKGTEHFLTDIHGEYEAFQHVLKNASGAVKRKVNEIFGHTLRESEKKEICTLIYYPEEKLQLIKEQETDLDDWYLITLNQLVPERFVQIYPFESTQGTSSRVLVYHSRAVARIEHRT